MTKKQTRTDIPDVEEERLREEEESVFDAFLRYQRQAAKETKLAFDALIPEGFKVHRREAKRAFKKSFKVLLEAIAERIDVPEEEEEEAKPRTTGKAKVKVEVS